MDDLLGPADRETSATILKDRKDQWSIMAPIDLRAAMLDTQHGDFTGSRDTPPVIIRSYSISSLYQTDVSPARSRSASP